ncbi:MAG: hypothetical protein KGS61_12430, partial [Verrucomicrobia bacterium]|nr:hypothetical protein [Verrucomicrobiota bacterium]
MRRHRNLVVSAVVVAIACVSTPAWALPAKAGSGFTAGDFAIGFRSLPGGIRLESLYDMRDQQEWCASNPPPLFRLTLRQVGSHKEARLDADRGWRRTSLTRVRDGFKLSWTGAEETALRGVAVTVVARADEMHSAWHWRLVVQDRNAEWGVTRVIFPQVALRGPEDGGAVFFPRGPGEVQTKAWQRAFVYHGEYPGGWCSMQFMAAYREAPEPAGLYLALQDPWGSGENLGVESEPTSGRLRLWFEEPAPNLGVAGNGFRPSGEAVLELFRGDWFDAAQIYKAWARPHARWWPRLGREGRADTPRWMRELNAWVMTGGAPTECVDRVKRFQQFLGLPVGFHWYNWHQIPFDNDYPHYFPAKPGFAEGVRELKSAQVYPMPYINGRLWDTHDRGTNDFEFTRLALPAATKQDDGQPYLERYGSRETNGERVALAVMCPATPLWQDTVRGIVLRLLHDVGTSGVYIDQVAAAPPKLCMDPRHGHPLGGGSWWNQGY